MDTTKIKNGIGEKVEQTKQVVENVGETAKTSIRKDPLKWVAGAFAGGLILGYLFKKKK
jgi:ElaB/YqjD/DUF883 family membrane-anchored ribosome-binding protein